VYLIEAGTPSAHYEDEKSRLRMSLIGAGTVVGEAVFLTSPRRATRHCVVTQALAQRHAVCRTVEPTLRVAQELTLAWRRVG
jgi:hypothetical protein